ncbi:MAG: chemotaxis protein CheW [Caulobacterales bacterium]|nr:chemotaxis protein CheW [Caulobacterales bacterium]
MSTSQAPRSVLAEADTREFVTLHVADQLFGVEVTDIHDVFAPQAITPVPLSPREIAGVLNLRGRIVTAIDARARLGLPPREDGRAGMAIGIEKGGESYGLIIDTVGEVLRLANTDFEANPCNLDPRWQEVSRGVYRLDERLLMVLDVDRMLEFEQALSPA